MAKSFGDGGYIDFLNYFKAYHSELSSKSPQPFVWSFTTPPYGMRKPESMLQLDFDKFRNIELEWSLKNGYRDQSENKAWFIMPFSGMECIDKTKVVSVESVSETLTDIVLSSGETYRVFADVNDANERLDTRPSGS